MSEPFFLIVGLGNPGAAYENTRHNVGEGVIKAFARVRGSAFRHASNLMGEVAAGAIEGRKFLLLFPTTFMNSSGDAVKRCVSYYRVPLDHMIVLCDDVALPVGKMRLRAQGSAGGHNGLKSIEMHLGTQAYPRLRIGVGAPENEALADYVLSRPSQKEEAALEKVMMQAVDALALWVSCGIAAAMKVINTEIKDSKGESNV